MRLVVSRSQSACPHSWSHRTVSLAPVTLLSFVQRDRLKQNEIPPLQLQRYMSMECGNRIIPRCVAKVQAASAKSVILYKLKIQISR